MISDEEIIEMAKQAGAIQYVNMFEFFINNELITFARAIAARQREIDAGICEAEYKAGEAGTGGLHCAAAIRGQG